MAFAAPTEPNDQELLAYLDGEAGPEVREHVEHCAGCGERIRQLARLQGQLTARLYRTDCPRSLDLGEYHLGLLPGERAAAVAWHLAECPHCARELDQLRGYLATFDAQASPAPFAQVQVLVAQLVGQITRVLQPPAALAPAYALRGEGGGALLYQVGDVQVSLQVQADPAHPGRRLLLGFLIGMPPAGLEACLALQGQAVATVPLDELGNLAVPDLAPGTYHLVVRGPDVEIHVLELEVA